jgi:nucleotide-binding universal stress UspA family protein
MYTNIVVGTDGSDTATKAVCSAADLAAIASANLVVVSAYRPVPEERLRSERAGAPADVAYMVNRQEDVDRILDNARNLAESRGVKKVITEGVDSGPSEAIIDVAERMGAELIVVGSQGMTGAKRFLLGSVPNRIAHHSPCDVLIIKTDPEQGAAS